MSSNSQIFPSAFKLVRLGNTIWIVQTFQTPSKHGFASGAACSAKASGLLEKKKVVLDDHLHLQFCSGSASPKHDHQQCHTFLVSEKTLEGIMTASSTDQSTDPFERIAAVLNFKKNIGLVHLALA
jgi:hypothetical protein